MADKKTSCGCGCMATSKTAPGKPRQGVDAKKPKK